MTQKPRVSSITHTTARIEAFSDGVFAIAITLLILDIHVPDFKPGENLLDSLYREWPGFLALLVGFFTILICWINHHYMFQLIHRSNSKLLLLNGFKLLVVSITPFATALLSKHMQSSWAHSAIHVYAFTFSLMGLAMTGIWCYSNKQGFTAGTSAKILKYTTRLYIFASAWALSIWIVSFFSIAASLVMFGIMFLIFIYPEKMVLMQVARQSRKQSAVVMEKQLQAEV